MKMKIIARLLNEASKGVPNVLIQAQTFSVKNKGWVKINQQRTTANGDLIIGNLNAKDVFGPMNCALRIVTLSRNQVALWSASPVIGVKGDELIFDFGQVVDFRKSKISLSPLSVRPAKGITQAGVDLTNFTALKRVTAVSDTVGIAGGVNTGDRVIGAIAEADIKLTEQVNILTEARTAAIKARELAAISDRIIALGERDNAIVAMDAFKAEAGNLLTVKNALEQELKTVRADADQKENLVARLRQEKSTLEMSKENVEVQMEMLKSQTDKKDEDLRMLKTQRDELSVKAMTAETKLIKEMAAKESLSNSVKSKTTISNVFDNIGKEVATANDKLGTKENPYRISGLKIAVKGALVEDGKSVLLNDLNNHAGTVATVEAHINPQSVKPTLNKVTVPNVIGLTSGAAGRVLESVGLAPNIAMTLLEKGQTPGQVTKQSPKARSHVDRGSKILLAIPKRPGLTEN